jgi:hypothetical protein
MRWFTTQPRGVRRELFTAAGALVLHLVLFAGLAMLRPAPRAVASPPLESVELAIESVERLDIVETDRETRAGSEPSVGLPRAVGIRAAFPKERAPAAPEAPSGSGSAGEDTSIQIASLSTTELGLGGGPNPFSTNTFAPPPPPAPKEPPKKRDFGFPRPKDATIGMGADGPVIAALEEATYGGFAPLNGSAVFLVEVDEDGLVTQLKLLRGRGGRGWEETREAALEALAGKKLSLRGARGAEFRIEVTSAMELPSGACPNCRYTVPLDRGYIIATPNRPEGGSADVVEARTVGKFDLSDIGSKARHVVRARLVSD